MRIVEKAIFLLTALVLIIFPTLILGSHLTKAKDNSDSFAIIYLAEDGKIYECQQDGSSAEGVLEIGDKKIEAFWPRPDGEQMVYRLAEKWPAGVWKDEEKVICLYTFESDSHEMLSQADFQKIPWIEDELVFKKPIFSPDNRYVCRYDREGPGLKIYEIQTGKILNAHSSVYKYPSEGSPPYPIWKEDSSGIICQIGIFDYDRRENTMYNTTLWLGVDGKKKKMKSVFTTERDTDFFLADCRGGKILFLYRKPKSTFYHLYLTTDTDLQSVSLIREKVVQAYFIPALPMAQPTVH